MKNGVKFGDKHSIDDWDLLLVSKNIESPEPKTLEVEIPGADGIKDLSEFFGLKYYNRNLTFDFDIFASNTDWWELHSKISNYLHGKKLKIILDVDSDYYYYGRCKITEFSNTHNVAHITINCDCDPYKYKIQETKDVKYIEPNKICTFYNVGREVIPIIETDCNFSFEYEGIQYSFIPGKHKNLNISLKAGINDIKIISGVGKISFSYQEASL